MEAERKIVELRNSNYQARLQEAWSFIKDRYSAQSTGESTQKKAAIRQEIASAMGVELRNFTSWLADDAFVQKSVAERNHDHRVATRNRKVVDYYRNMNRILHPHWALGGAVSSLLKFNGGHFEPLRDYIGTYSLLFLDDGSKLTSDSLTIDNVGETKPMMFVRRINRWSGTGQVHEQSGIVVKIAEQIHLLGIGFDQTRRYVRASIFRAVDNPRSECMFGVTIGEEGEARLPTSRKVVLFPGETTDYPSGILKYLKRSDGNLLRVSLDEELAIKET